MAQDARIAILNELPDVLVGVGDPDLDATRVAIYLEDALDVVLPAEALDRHHLGSVEAITALLPGLVEES
ncbi:MAG: hypothetical protein AAGC63_03040 [Propionicimonas sp.]|nr:hypothetical protein [Propionicimonas sp.]